MWLILLRTLPWLGRLAPVAGIVKGNSKLIGIGLSVITMLATWWYINSLQSKVQKLEASAVVIESQLSDAQSANESNLSTIRSLEDANASLADAIEVTADDIARSISESARKELEAKLRLDDTIYSLEALRNANPTCEQLANIDMSSACPAVVGRMRQHAASANN